VGAASCAQRACGNAALVAASGIESPDQFRETDMNRPAGLVPNMLNHLAYVTHDVAATADFYTRILGMELASTIFDDHVPSTGADIPYFHIFFRMGDGSTIAFFECLDLPPAATSTHPAYDTFNHCALQVADRDEVRRWRDWLVSNGIEVIGPIDHKGMVESIYFHDPNGIRLELTTPVDPDWNRHGERGRADLALWVETKERARAEGRDPSQALLEMIRATKQQRYAASH
jgi:catechol 2,3-dioxygenase-like lactoylglutathione lyase family enzyme